MQAGPWGGGNRFVADLIAAIRARGGAVTTALADDDIDIVLMIDPRWRNPAVTFGPGAIARYLAFRNRRALVVHRVNECDERKGTTGMNRRLGRANAVADHTVFIAEWLRRDLAVWHDKTPANSSIIRNGADTAIFHPRGHASWPGEGPLRIVTHHWGGNWMKGFDVYRRLDAMLAEPGWRDRIVFTYIGNLPRDFAFENATYVPPLDGAALAEALRSQHVYVTASLNEPAGYHHIEGALCGLPVLYRNSGALPEYCQGFGVMFEGPEDFEPALERMTRDYAGLTAKMPSYPYTASNMVKRYIDLFEELVARRDEILVRRQHCRGPFAFLRNQAQW